MGHLEVVRVAGLATIQDAGRTGHMHEGVPPGGALVPELLGPANRAVHNPREAPAIELFGTMTLRAHENHVLVAFEDGATRILAPGEVVDVRASGAFSARYVAVRGGIDVPMILGGRGTHLAAGFGGFEGRALRRGDRLPVGGLPKDRQARESSKTFDSSLEDAVRIVLGPDENRFGPSVVEQLLSNAFQVLPSSNRTGTRLAGPKLSRPEEDSMRSLPMVRGAIEVPASGEPIVLGPDHPTTGGYPVIAVVAQRDLGRLAARKIGAHVRFRAVSVEEARAAFREQ